MTTAVSCPWCAPSGDTARLLRGHLSCRRPPGSHTRAPGRPGRRQTLAQEGQPDGQHATGAHENYPSSSISNRRGNPAAKSARDFTISNSSALTHDRPGRSAAAGDAPPFLRPATIGHAAGGVWLRACPRGRRRSQIGAPDRLEHRERHEVVPKGLANRLAARNRRSLELVMQRPPVDAGRSADGCLSRLMVRPRCPLLRAGPSHANRSEPFSDPRAAATRRHRAGPMRSGSRAGRRLNHPQRSLRGSQCTEISGTDSNSGSPVRIVHPSRAASAHTKASA